MRTAMTAPITSLPIDCRDITKGNPAKRVQYCPQIIAQTFEKCMEILEERGLL